MAANILIQLGIILTIGALMVRFGGDRAILGGSRNAGIRDMKGLNAWAGNRLALLPVVAFGFVPFVPGNNAVAVLAFMTLLFSFFGVVIWIHLGAKRFR